jgi:alkylation response protein AidB-like acyl-CoA dehydrogenase
MPAGSPDGTEPERTPVSPRKTFAGPHEPHTWFDAFESPEERSVRKEVRAFAWEQFEHLRDETDVKMRSNQLMPLLGERGYIGTMVATQHGGAGQNLATSVVIGQELGGVIPSLAAMRAVCGNFVAKPLEEFGTTEQIDRFLRPVMTGEITTALAISEPGSGSDVASIAMTARRDGTTWILNGTKQHISGATESGFMLVYAVTRPEASSSDRLTAFLVPTDSPGVDASEPEATMGVRGLSHARVQFDDVRIDDDLRLGEEGEGLRILFFGLSAERVDIASRALGCATRAFEEARAYADAREQFGKPIRAFQAVSHKVSEMRIIIDAGRLLVLRAARLYDRVLREKGAEHASEACNEESSIAKLFCGEKCFWVCDTAMQIFGGLGYEQGTAVESMFRDSRVFRFGGGTDEIQRHIIQRDEYKRLALARESN